eukprot:1002755-Prymnesium_polylepis.1
MLLDVYIVASIKVVPTAMAVVVVSVAAVASARSRKCRVPRAHRVAQLLLVGGPDGGRDAADLVGVTCEQHRVGVACGGGGLEMRAVPGAVLPGVGASGGRGEGLGGEGEGRGALPGSMKGSPPVLSGGSLASNCSSSCAPRACAAACAGTWNGAAAGRQRGGQREGRGGGRKGRFWVQVVWSRLTKSEAEEGSAWVD